MRSLFLSALALAAFLTPAAPAWGDDVADRTEAIRLCRAEVAARTGLAVEEVRFDTVRIRTRAVRVDLDVWRDGQLENVRCEVERGETLIVATITPPLQTTQAAAQ